MTDPLPPGWIEVTITARDYDAERATGKYHPRVCQNDVLMIIAQRRGIRMAAPFSLLMAEPYAIVQGQGEIVLRQGPG